MTAQFKVGDRVMVYGPGWNMKLVKYQEPIEWKWSANVINYETPNTQYHTLIVEKNNTRFVVYPEQCRLLKKKERRRLYINPSFLTKDKYESTGDINHAVSKSPSCHPEWVEFIEAKKK